jgi:hypothetical protein
MAGRLFKEPASTAKLRPVFCLILKFHALIIIVFTFTHSLIMGFGSWLVHLILVG